MRTQRFHLLALISLAACGSSASPDAGARDSAPADAATRDSGTTDSAASDSGVDAEMLDASPDAGALDTDALPARLAAAYCEAQRPCCEVDSSVTADCEARVSAAVAALIAPTANKRYDAAAAAACVAALEALPRDCDGARAAVNTYQGACADVVNGELAPGEPCEFGEFCQRPAGAIGDTLTGFVGCAAYGSQPERRCRVFLPTHDVGTACEMAFGGAESTVFVCARGELYCEAGSCLAVGALGEACATPTACATDATCDLATNICIERGPEGADCSSAACVHGLDCVADICVTDATPKRLFGPCLGSAGCVDLALACTPLP